MKVWIQRMDGGFIDKVVHVQPGDLGYDFGAVVEGTEGKVLVDRDRLWLALRRQVAGAMAIGEVVDRCSWPGCEFGVAIQSFGGPRGCSWHYHPAHTGDCPLREDGNA